MGYRVNLFVRVVILFFVFISPAFSGEEAVWNTLIDVNLIDNKLRLQFSADEKLTFKGCETLVLDIEEYDNFKWDFVARITGSVRPEKDEPLDELLSGLNQLKGAKVYIAERSPLKRISSCHFLSDGAVLNKEYLFVFFKLYHL